MRIASLHTYPVKGSHRLDHDEARVEPRGLAGARRWMIVDPDGVGITQRKAAVLTALRPVLTPGGLVLRAPGLPDLAVAEPVDGPKQEIRVFSNKPPVPARIAVEADAWVAAFLGRPARLVWQADAFGRPVQNNAEEGDVVSFADGYPLLLANAASLDALNDWLAEAGEEPVPMTRFRPNVVVAGAPPWAEDGWIGRRVRLGEVEFRVAKACDRCVVTTIDQETGDKGRQPLRILGQYRRFDNGVLFAVNLIPSGPLGLLRVGDPALVLP
jgi:uncharacterized protein YcbX